MNTARDVLSCLVETLVFDLVTTIKCTRGPVPSTPNIMTMVINNEACRGIIFARNELKSDNLLWFFVEAIKFGDVLNQNLMERYLTELSHCKLPFQCAHGRPTLASIVNLGKREETRTKLNLKKLILQKSISANV